MKDTGSFLLSWNTTTRNLLLHRHMIWYNPCLIILHYRYTCQLTFLWFSFFLLLLWPWFILNFISSNKQLIEVWLAFSQPWAILGINKYFSYFFPALTMSRADNTMLFHPGHWPAHFPGSFEPESARRSSSDHGSQSPALQRGACTESSPAVAPRSAGTKSAHHSIRITYSIIQKTVIEYPDMMTTVYVSGTFCLLNSNGIACRGGE